MQNAGFQWNEHWPPELKEAMRTQRRGYYLVQNLEARLFRMDPDGQLYAETVDRLLLVQEALIAAKRTFCAMLERYEYEQEQEYKRLLK